MAQFSNFSLKIENMAIQNIKIQQSFNKSISEHKIQG
jgi:hypothetical protein